MFTAGYSFQCFWLSSLSARLPVASPRTSCGATSIPSLLRTWTRRLTSTTLQITAVWQTLGTLCNTKYTHNSNVDFSLDCAKCCSTSCVDSLLWNDKLHRLVRHTVRQVCRWCARQLLHRLHWTLWLQHKEQSRHSNSYLDCRLRTRIGSAGSTQSWRFCWYWCRHRLHPGEFN